MRPPHPRPFRFAEADRSRSLSAVNFSRTPLGRAVLHLECLCHHPVGARFHLEGFTRNLREYAAGVKLTALKSLHKVTREKPARPGSVLIPSAMLG